jgi:hypothetical protein
MSMPSQFFSDVTQGYYGALTQAASDAVWQEFLQSQGVSSVSDTTQTRTKYLTFLSQKLNVVNASDAANALSPKEVSARHMVVTIFDLLLAVLGRLSVEQIRNGEAISVLVKKQKEYLNLLQRMPTYVGSGTITQHMYEAPVFGISAAASKDRQGLIISTADSQYYTPIHTSTNPAEFSLGYGGITLEDVLGYLYDDLENKLKANPPVTSSTFSMTSGTFLTNRFGGQYWDRNTLECKNYIDLKIEKIPNSNNVTLLVSFRTDHTEYVGSGRVTTVFSNQSSTNLDMSNRTSVLAAFNSSFQNVWSAAKANNLVEVSSSSLTADEKTILSIDYNAKSTEEQDLILRSRNVKINWPQGILLSTWENVTDTSLKQDLGAAAYQAQQTRAQKNQMLSSLTEALKGRRDTLRDKADQLAQVGESGRTSRSQTIAFVKQLVNQLRNILSSIFR